MAERRDAEPVATADVADNSGDVDLRSWQQSSEWGKWTFSVATPVVTVGADRAVELDDLVPLEDEDKTKDLVALLRETYAVTRKLIIFPRLLISLWKAHMSRIWWSGLHTILEGATRVVIPVFLAYLLDELLDPESPKWRAYVWATAIVVITFIQIILHHILFFLTAKVGWHFRITSIGFIFDNLMAVNMDTLRGLPGGSGQLVNLISNDVSRFDEYMVFFHYAWESLIETAAILILMAYLLDIYASLAGVGATLACIPLQVYIAKKFGKIRTRTATKTDRRIRQVSETLEGIGSVKAYGWEVPFFDQIGVLREEECEIIEKSMFYRAINQALYFFVPPLAGFAAFSVHWAMGHELTISKVFSVISLLQTLRNVMGRFFTRALETTSEVISCCRRIDAFLSLGVGSNNESGAAAASGRANAGPSEGGSSSLVDIDDKTKPILMVEKSSYSYGYAQNAVLNDVQLSVKRGELLVVVGSVGAGKSSLLSAILGELSRSDGEEVNSSSNSTSTSKAQAVHIPSECRLAFCSQRPWILATSVRSNITLAGKNGDIAAHPHLISDQQLYDTALDSCRLREDMTQWSASDLTEIGERGVSISGGQRARVALARAVYSDAHLYLLDDPLSAVDAHVGNKLFNDCIVGALKTRGKAIVLVTHQLQFLPRADKILVLDTHGNQVFYGVYSELEARSEEFPFLDLRKRTEAVEDSSAIETPAEVSSQDDAKEVDVARDIEAHIRSTDNIDLDPISEEAKLEALEEEALEEQQKQSAANGEVQLILSDGIDSSSSSSSSEGDKEEVPGDVESAAPPRGAMERMHKSMMSVRNVFQPQRKNQGQNRSFKLGTFSGRASLDRGSSQNVIIQTEDRNKGEVSIATYLEYFRAGGSWSGLFAVSLTILGQMVNMVCDYWPRWWAGSVYGDQRDVKYVWVFGVLAFGCMLIGFLKSITWFEFSLRASKNLHQTCLWGVMRSPLQFFVANPTGRILNRFSKDQNVVDESFPMTTYETLQVAAFCASAIIIVCVSIPYVTIILVPLGFGFVNLRTKYIKCSREVKRIESTTRSPIYADFSSILEGITTVRAYKIDKVVATMFQRQVDDNSKSWFNFVILNRWLGLRLDMETFFVLIAAVYPAVALKGSIDVGLLGFALVYVLNLSALFQWMVRMSTEVENQMTSVERIQAYSKLPAEEGYALKSFHDRTHSTVAAVASPRSEDGTTAAAVEGGATSTRPARARTISSEVIAKYLKLGQSAPAEEAGAGLQLTQQKAQNGPSLFELNHLFVTYRDDLDPVIKDLSLSIPAGSKLGICGRTGSGKSSLLLALLRLNIIESGDIVFDGKSLLSMSLEDARSLVSVIPQEPHLFSGTIRTNLDPFNKYSDAEIWDALENAHIKNYISRDPLGLQASVTESGSNFSIGQRQLLSLSRAILRRCPIVLMDEVTASIDYQTDRLIQLTIRSSPALKSATIITIAHRLRTIADSDYIAVISAGVLSEFGPPSELIAKPGSLFKSLAEETNEYQDIYSIVTAHAETSRTSSQVE